MAAKAKQRGARDSVVRNSGSSSTFTQRDSGSRSMFEKLSEVNTKRVLEPEDVDELEGIVAEILKCQNTDYSLAEGIKLDYYVSGLWWCREQSFSTEQTSAFYSLMELLLQNIEKNMTLVDLIAELKQIVVLHCPDSNNEANSNITKFPFNVQQSRDIVDYFCKSLFQHYRLYESFFHIHPEEFLIGLDTELDIPKSAYMIWPPPLAESIPEDVFIQQFGNEQERSVSSISIVANASYESKATAEMLPGDVLVEESLLAQLSPEEIKIIIKEVYTDMLSGVEEQISAKIKEKQNLFMTRINQIRIIDKAL